MGANPGVAQAPAEQQGGLVGIMRASEPAIRQPGDDQLEEAARPPDDIVEDAPEHRKRTARQVRHVSRTRLHVLVGDDEALEDADLLCPQAAHDLGRKASRPPRKDAKPGRRGGFKVWKTPFWKRRRQLWAQRNAEARRLAETED
jgi:hypothetical protein